MSRRFAILDYAGPRAVASSSPRGHSRLGFASAALGAAAMFVFGLAIAADRRVGGEMWQYAWLALAAVVAPATLASLAAGVAALLLPGRRRGYALAGLSMCVMLLVIVFVLNVVPGVPV